MSEDIKNKVKENLKAVSELALIYLTENGVCAFKDSQFLFENKYIHCKVIDIMYSHQYLQAYVYNRLDNNVTSAQVSNILIPHHFVAWIEQRDKFVEKKKFGLTP